MKIKKYESKVKANPGRNDAIMDTSSVSARARETAGAGEALSGIGDAMIKAQALQEHTDASNKATTATRELILKAKADPDYKNSDKYVQQLSGIKSTAAKGLTLRASKTQFESDFASLSNSALLDIKQDSRTKMVNKGVADLNMALDQSQEIYIAEGNDTRQKQIIKRMDSLIDAHIQRGYLTPDAGYKLKQSRIETLGVKKFYGDLSAISSPSQADHVMSALRDGHYEQNGTTIDPQKKESMYNTIEKYKTKLETDQIKTMKVAQNQNETNWSVAISRGEAGKLGGLNGLQQAALNGEIDTASFERLEKAMTTTGSVAASQKSAAFVSLSESFYSLKLDEEGIAEGNTVDELRNFRNAVTDAYNEKKIDAADFQGWIDKTTPDYLEKNAPKFDAVRAGIDLMKKVALSMFGGSPAMAASMTRDFINRSAEVSAEEVPQEAANIVNENRIKADPELAVSGEKAGSTSDKNGVIRKTYKPAEKKQDYVVGQEITNAKGEKAIVTAVDPNTGKIKVRRVQQEKENASAE